MHWFTGTSIPCLSIFKPVYFKAGIPELGEKPTNKYDKGSYWWRFEKFHTTFQTDYQTYINEFVKERGAVQKEIIDEEKTTKTLKRKTREELFSLTKRAFDKESELLGKWEEK